MKILVIEDERELAEGLAVLFEKKGYSVDLCLNGEDGFYRMLSGIYDVVILDIMLPVMDGITILTKAREQEIRTPVILLTAKAEIDDKVRGLDCGADDYITKPFDAEELLARVRARIRNEHEKEFSLYSYGDICLDRSRHELSCGLRRVKLGHKEYELMEYMLINAGQILTRDMLISKVWDPEEEPEYNHLEVYISFLRKKLRFVHAKTAIITTKNVGYSLEDAEGRA